MSHELIEAEGLRTSDAYRLMTDLVAPRPIAWVGTVDGEGRRNLAPFSYFQAVCSQPPTLVLSVGWRGDGTAKDTLRNILDTRTFTVSHVSRPLAESMNATAAALAADESEWDVVGVKGRPSTRVQAPWVEDAHAAFECSLQQAIPLGRTRHGTPSSTLLVATVLLFHVREGLLRRTESGRLAPMDPSALDAVGRLGGMTYTETSARFDLARPIAPEKPR